MRRNVPAVDEIDADFVESGVFDSSDGIDSHLSRVFSPEKSEHFVVERLNAERNASKTGRFPSFCAFIRHVLGVRLERTLGRCTTFIGDLRDDFGKQIVAKRRRRATAKIDAEQAMVAIARCAATKFGQERIDVIARRYVRTYRRKKGAITATAQTKRDVDVDSKAILEPCIETYLF